MSNCSICNLSTVKYTCPACGMKTCSFPCVQKHKVDYKCSGTVDQTKFLPRTELSNDVMHVHRDYNFLMKVGRKITLGKDDIKANAKNVFKRQYHANNNQNNKRFKNNQDTSDPRKALVEKCFPHSPPTLIRRNNTFVVQLPLGMSRALSNKSGFDKKVSSYIWTVEWVFIGDHGDEVTRFISYRLKEALSLKDAVPTNILNKTITEKQLGEPVDKEELHFYLENVLDRKRRNDGKKSIIRLAATALISDALRDKVVVEFPTIYVMRSEEVWKESIGEQLIDDSEDEESSSSSSSDEDSSDDSDDSDDSDGEAPEEASSKPAAETIQEPTKQNDLGHITKETKVEENSETREEVLHTTGNADVSA